MTIKDLQDVRCGNVTLYEDSDTPERGRFHDLYCGMSQQIPEELRNREVLLASPLARRGTSATIDIQLTPVHKKAHEKSPA